MTRGAEEKADCPESMWPWGTTGAFLGSRNREILLVKALLMIVVITEKLK